MKGRPVSKADDLDRTAAGMTGTFTSAGFVSHLPVAIDGGHVMAPVKLTTTIGPRGAPAIVFAGATFQLLPVPLTRNGLMAFALPGGGETLASPSIRR